MTQQPMLSDQTALNFQRIRARKAGLETFLQEAVFLEMQERLATINKALTDAAIVSPWPEVWSNLRPNAKVLADDEFLDFGNQKFDLIVHAMGLHWSNDPVGQIIQCSRALRPDGLFLGALFGGQTLHELRACLAQAESRISGGLSPRVLPMGDVRDLGGLLQRSGLNLPVADTMTLNVSYSDAFALMRDLRAMGETNALASRPRSFARRDVLFEAARLYQDSYATDDGRIHATFEVVTLTGWVPHDSQQKPMRPGSAEARLADALNAQEFNLPKRES